ncbi:MAG: DUF4340 domain-containing protein [Planctomycetota bacterium]|nr:DUF4340 domain-containing protein [Planctomycetota bacterium]
MKETTRTFVFCGIAAIAVVGAFAAHRISQPPQLEGYDRVGEPFFPEFTDPTAAKGLRVAVYNAESAEIKLFDVVNKNGVWTIPSRHDYPADGADRLAETASSVIGITRGALESRREADFERLGVIDPLNESSTALKGRGQRLTISGDSEPPLADLIIGNPVPDKSNEYYVRRADEKEVYRTKLAINLSTKFADWIEADLLKLERDTLKDIVVRKYSVDEQKMALTGMEISELARDKPGDPWTLNELDETTEEVNTEAVNTLVSLLDDLKIVGVRPKPAGLSKNLKVSEDLKLDPISAMDLRSKGFLVARDQDGRQIFVADEGEMLASTNQGVVYHLYFGEVSTGTDVEIELGKTPEENAAEAEKETTEGDDTPDEKDDEKKQGQNRYMFVTVNFDETLIGPPLQEPVAPTKPSAEAESKSEDATPEAETESESESEPLTEGTDDNKTDDAESATDAEDEAKAEDEVKAENAEAPADEPTEPQAEAKPTAEEAEAAYQQALKLYEADLAKYKLDVSQRTEKTKQGQEIVKDLNDRFANWYYVISASSFENLRLGRAAFVKPKTAETDDTTEGNPAPPDASNQKTIRSKLKSRHSNRQMKNPPTPKRPRRNNRQAIVLCIGR